MVRNVDLHDMYTLGAATVTEHEQQSSDSVEQRIKHKRRTW